MQAYPDLTQQMPDKQMLLPTIVMQHGSLWLQVLFLGALLSAIMSTASGAILAPASVLAINLIKPHLKNQSEANQLRWLRLSVVGVTVAAVLMACWNNNIYHLVSESSALSLVSLFVPLVAAIYHKNTHESGMIGAMFAGLFVWLFCAWIDTAIPAMLWGLLASFIGLLLGNYWGNRQASL
jgi:Na+/proline symporter